MYRIPLQHLTLLLACLLPAALLRGAAVAATAMVVPEAPMVGERAEYRITFRNTTRLPNITTPRVDGLDFSDAMSTSSMQQIINGRMTVETSASWSFNAARTGAFTIPGRTVRIEGQDVAVPPVSFEAIPVDEETRSRALLRLEIPEGPFHVGEAIPARLGLFIRDDLGIGNITFPQRIGDDFIHDPFDDNPRRGRSRIDGRVYQGVVWDFILTPIRSGPAELRFSQSVTIQMSISDSRFPSIFSMSRTQSETLNLYSDPVEVVIQPLPEAGRPEAFSDAVGQFEFTAALSSHDLQVGEPITLTLALEGTGNFDRIGPPELSDWENWRVYPPKTDFTPQDERGLSGRKTFEYILIPQSTEITAIPELSYAYFDPQSEDYATTVIEAVPVSVRPSDKPAPDWSRNGEVEPDPTARIPDALLPIRPGTGRLLPLRDSLWQRPLFWSVQAAIAAVLLLARILQARRRRLRTDHRLARRHYGGRKVRKLLSQARQAAQAGNAAAFYAAARAAIQEKVSHLTNAPAEIKTLVSSDCLDILRQSSLPETRFDQCARLLDAADAHQFAGVEPAPEALSQQMDALESLISALNRLQQ
jgi:hypothetical protein